MGQNKRKLGAAPGGAQARSSNKRKLPARKRGDLYEAEQAVADEEVHKRKYDVSCVCAECLRLAARRWRAVRSPRGCYTGHTCGTAGALQARRACGGGLRAWDAASQLAPLLE